MMIFLNLKEFHELNENESAISEILNTTEKLRIKSFYNALSLFKRDNPNYLHKCDMLPNGVLKFNPKTIKMHDILSKDLNGQQALKFYKENRKLNAYFRSKIIYVIIDYIAI